MLFIKRLLANLVDITVFFTTVVMAFLYVHPFLHSFIAGFTENEFVAAVIMLILVAAVNAGLQYPFMVVHQTLGKAFFGLKVVSTNDQRPMTASILLQRELFGKVATGYLLCLPVLFRKPGGHEIVTETAVVANK